MNEKKLPIAVPFLLTAVILGFLYAWADRHSINSMGIAYLDIADAYINKDWSNTINGYWSPLYSWLLALAMLVLKPSPYWEFSVVHLVNFGIYLFTLGCFHFFLLELIQYHYIQHGRLIFPKWIWLTFGYTLFLWSSLYLITLKSPTPDMGVAAFLYLIFGILLRIRMGATQWFLFVLLGIVLGFNYLAKAAMFPLSFVFLGTAMFCVRKFRIALPRVMVSLAIFLLVCSPLIIALSKSKGHFTYGETGKLNYAWIVNGIPQFHHWQGGPSASGVPEHPTRIINDSPVIYEFAAPVGGTYPVWYDPSYWHEGLKVYFEPGRQLQITASNLKHSFKRFFIPTAVLLMLNLMGSRPLFFLRNILQYWCLLIPAGIAYAMYALVSVQLRYIAPFAVVFFAVLFASISFPKSKILRLMQARLSKAALLLIIIPGFSYMTIKKAYEGFHSTHEQWQIAQGLNQLGIEPGDKIITFGQDDLYTNMPYDSQKKVPYLSMNAYWARLARVQIIAEAAYGGANIFWNFDNLTRSKIIEKLRMTGAKGIVSKGTPEHASDLGWKKIANSSYYLYVFPR